MASIATGRKACAKPNNTRTVSTMRQNREDAVNFGTLPKGDRAAYIVENVAKEIIKVQLEEKGTEKRRSTQVIKAAQNEKRKARKRALKGLLSVISA